MSDRTSEPHDPVEAILEEFLEQRDAGAEVDVEALFRAHPEHAEELRLHLQMMDLAATALISDEPHPNDVPRDLGPYRLLEELGTGGMGRVFLAECREAAAVEPGARVALKVVHPHLFRGAGFFKRFLREAELGRRVEHPNVVRTLDADAVEVGGRHHHFIVMEYVKGRTLRNLAQELDRVPEELCRHIAHEVATALDSVHAVGAVHRDVKPENVLITPDHVVKLMDLGVARLTEETARLSQTGAFVGSVHYAAPEQFGGDGANVDARTDLHALGVVLYELSTGRHPFDADDVPAVMRRVLEETPRPAGKLNPQLSPFFEQVVGRLLAKQPADRFSSASEVAQVFDESEASEWWQERAREIRSTTCRPLRRIRIPRETSVYGRGEELGRLRRAFESARGGAGCVILLEGEAGIGKTRLVDEFVLRLQGEGEELDFLFGSYAPGGRVGASGAFSTAFREHLGDAGASSCLATTPLLVPAFDAVLRGEPTPPGAVPVTKDSLATCFVQATRSLAEQRMIVLLIDDLHFAAQEAHELFLALALAVPGHRVLLIGTARPGLPEDWRANLTRLSHAQRLELGRLGPKDLAALLGDSFQSERLALELAGQIGIKSDGNPFFVFEIIQGLREDQFITQRDDGTWASTRAIHEIAIPSSVLDLVNARVATLEDTERHLLDVASCCGFDFDPLLIGETLGIARIAALQTLAKIEKRDRLVRSAGRSFVFDHHQVQEALYQSLPDLLREEYHRTLAETLERRSGAAEVATDELPGELCIRLSNHFLGGAGGSRTKRYLPRAIAHLVGAHENAEAVRLGQAALTAAIELSERERCELLLSLCEPRGALDLLGQAEQHRAMCEQAVELSRRLSESELVARSLGARSIQRLRVSDLEGAEWDVRDALKAVAGAADLELRRNLISHLGTVNMSAGRSDRARALYEEALVLSRELGNLAGEAGDTVNIGVTLKNEGRLERAREQYETGLRLCREAGHVSFEAICTANLGTLLRHMGELDGALEMHHRALELHRSVGDRRGAALMLGQIAIDERLRGNFADASRLAEDVLPLYREIGDRSGEAGALTSAANTRRAMGYPHQALELHEEALAVDTAIGDERARALSLGNLGNVMMSLGQLEDAKEKQEGALEISRAMGDRLGETMYLANLAETLASMGRLDEASQCASRSRAMAGAASLLPLQISAELVLAWVRSELGDSEEACEHISAAYRLSIETSNTPATTAVLTLGASRGCGRVHEAEESFRLHGDRLAVEIRKQSSYELWVATSNPAYLAAAKRLLDETLAKVPEEYHDSMCQNVRVNREILAAWRKEYGEDDDSSTESPTRAG